MADRPKRSRVSGSERVEKGAAKRPKWMMELSDESDSDNKPSPFSKDDNDGRDVKDSEISEDDADADYVNSSSTLERPRASVSSRAGHARMLESQRIREVSPLRAEVFLRRDCLTKRARTYTFTRAPLMSYVDQSIVTGPRPCCQRCAGDYISFPGLICWNKLGTGKCGDCHRKGKPCEPFPAEFGDELRTLQQAADQSLALPKDSEAAEHLEDSSRLMDAALAYLRGRITNDNKTFKQNPQRRIYQAIVDGNASILAAIQKSTEANLDFIRHATDLLETKNKILQTSQATLSTLNDNILELINITKTNARGNGRCKSSKRKEELIYQPAFGGLTSQPGKVLKSTESASNSGKPRSQAISKVLRVLQRNLASLEENQSED